MNFNLDVRLKQLESLEQYISSSRDKVQSILDCLNWDTKEVLKESQLIKCSVDPSHKVPLKSVDEHVKNCSLRKEDYELDEDFLSEPLHDLNSSILLDDHKKIEILSAAHRSIPNFKSGWNGQDPDPKTANRLLCTFSPHERSALYSYAVKHTIGPPVLPEFNTIQPPKSSDKPLTFEELRMKERDAKRRRIKYKYVHTNHKSHKEVLREVIDGQMELYMEWLVDNGLVETKLEQTYDCSITNEQNVKSEYEQSYVEHQKSRHSSISDFRERSHSVVSKNSTCSGSSKSTSKKSYQKNRYEYNHYRRYDDYDYKGHDRTHSNIHNQSSYRRQNREHHERRKHRSHSKDDLDSRNRYDNSKIR